MITVLIFGIGLIFGVYLEQQRSDDFNKLFFESESSLFDTLALVNLLDSKEISCSDLIAAEVVFADKIFEEALSLEKFDESNKLTDSLKSIHKKYDLLRTILWINSIDIKEKCLGINNVVYLYEYSTENVNIKAKQNVLAKVLFDFKQEQGNNILLIPIAVDNDVVSLEYLVELYGIESFPAIIINEEHIIYEVSSTEEIEIYLDN
tara:strand:- start:633 stop:1250 length:618 start_codon:yes stop_codon:yes gene_type:complete